jgi:hypothetical protein
MPKFRKKPVEIEARLWRGGWEAAKPLLDWIGAKASWCDDDTIRIQTLEGEMVARPGDFIIKGVKGEFYPCKQEIFALTYEPAHAG